MSFLCCGRVYSKNDPETYQYIETDVIRDFTKKKIGKNTVVKQIVETLLCCKNGCTKVKNKYFGRGINGKLKILEVERLKGTEAINFLQETEGIRIRQPQKQPFPHIPFAKNIDLCYGKVTSSQSQRARYLNEQAWQQDSSEMISECFIYHPADTEKRVSELIDNK